MFLSDIFSSSGTFANATGGRITLRDGTGRLTGAGSLSNSGLLTGDGTIAKPLSNNATGEIRAEAGKTLAFTGVNAPNAGKLNLQEGTLEFTQTLTNASNGFISGRGALHTGGLTNNGVMAFSGGNADIFGDVNNTSGARIVTSGAGATTTFYDDVIHNGLEIFTGPGGSTVFFGDQSGAGPFTGTGTVFYIGDLRPGNSPAGVRYEGDLIFGSAATLTLEIGGLTAGSDYDHIAVAGTLYAAGWLKVSLLDGFTPQPGDTFDFIDAGTITGSFDAIEFPALGGGLSWDTSRFASTGEAAVVPEPGSIALLLAGAALFALRRRLRARA